jgi:MraZ protein
VTPPRLYGQFPVSCDPKNRILVPGEIRKRLDPEVHGKDFMIVAGEKGRPWLYPFLYYDGLASDLKGEIAPNLESSEFDRLFFGFAHPVEPDNQGRILIPAPVMTWTGMEKQSKFYLVCARDHFEIWDLPSWEIERKLLLGRRNEVIDKARQAAKTRTESQDA